jgi:hypothetical protein
MVESFPHVFIHDACNVLKDVGAEDLKMFLIKDGEVLSAIDSAKVISNL